MGIIDLIYPKICVGCKREGSYICNSCFSNLAKPEEICPMCGKVSLDGYTHKSCLIALGVDRLIVSLPYRGVVQDCLKKVKYRGAWDLLKFLYSKCEFGELKSAIVVPVPMWEGSENKRGFNQAKIIAQLLAKEYGFEICEVLKRVRATKPMYGLGKLERKNNIYNAFKIESNLQKFVLNKTIILVDDVWTTGSTMLECARVLKHDGVKDIWCIAMAR